MAKDRHVPIEEVERALSWDGSSWQDYVLLANDPGEPASIILASSKAALLIHIEDSALAFACAQYLEQRGTRIFTTFTELQRAFGFPTEFKIDT